MISSFIQILSRIIYFIWTVFLKKKNNIQEAGLTLKFDKCTFAASELKFLAHVITEKGGAVLPEKIEAVRDSRYKTSIIICNSNK